MSSKTSIANAALALLGDDISIISFSDDTKAGRYVSLMYPQALDFVLRTYPWRFALKRWSLPKTTEKPVYGYENVFVYPSECLRVIKVDGNWSYTVEGNRIYSEADTFNFTGIQRITDTAKFDSSFTYALTLYLAAQLCPAITGDLSLQKSLLEQYNLYVEQAKTTSSFESSGNTYQVHGLLDSRLW